MRGPSCTSSHQALLSGRELEKMDVHHSLNEDILRQVCQAYQRNICIGHLKEIHLRHVIGQALSSATITAEVKSTVRLTLNMQKFPEENKKELQMQMELLFQTAFIAACVKRDDFQSIQWTEIDRLLHTYPEFKALNHATLTFLLKFRNASTVFLAICGANRNKERCLDIAAKICGCQRDYKTGSGESPELQRRIKIYRTEGNAPKKEREYQRKPRVAKAPARGAKGVAKSSKGTVGKYSKKRFLTTHASPPLPQGGSATYAPVYGTWPAAPVVPVLPVEHWFPYSEQEVCDFMDDLAWDFLDAEQVGYLHPQPTGQEENFAALLAQPFAITEQMPHSWPAPAADCHAPMLTQSISIRSTVEGDSPAKKATHFQHAAFAAYAMDADTGDVGDTGDWTDSESVLAGTPRRVPSRAESPLNCYGTQTPGADLLVDFATDEEAALHELVSQLMQEADEDM